MTVNNFLVTITLNLRGVIFMDELKNDLLKTKEVIDEKEDINYSRIYIRTNEELDKLFSCFSVKDKNVLTVLASSDQAFCSYYLGAKSVDTFDKNKLTGYYYYLRKWLIEYMSEFSPSNKKVNLSNEWIYDLLMMVECRSEKEEIAYNYWYVYTMNTLGFLGKNLFYINKDFNKTMISDLEKLKGIIRDKDLSFRCQNICEDIDKSRKYNTVIMSNILEYNSYDRNKLRVCRDNLYDILEDDGEVICTNLIDKHASSMEQAIFEEKFELENFQVYRSDYGFKRDKLSVGYCYKKKL